MMPPSRPCNGARKALEPAFRMVPILLGGIGPAALRPLFGGVEPLAIHLDGEVEAILPEILTALGLRKGRDAQTVKQPAAPPVAELRLELEEPRLDHDAENGKIRAAGRGKLVFSPADGGRAVESKGSFRFTAPLGPIEAGELQGCSRGRKSHHGGGRHPAAVAALGTPPRRRELSL